MIESLFLGGCVIVALVILVPKFLRKRGVKITADPSVPGCQEWEVKLIQDKLVEKRQKEAQAKLLTELAEVAKS